MVEVVQNIAEEQPKPSVEAKVEATVTDNTEDALIVEKIKEVTPEDHDLTRETRVVEALLFAASEPVSRAFLAERLPDETDVVAILENLQNFYSRRGVNLARVAGKWSLRTAEDLSPHLRIERCATVPESSCQPSTVPLQR